MPLWTLKSTLFQMWFDKELPCWLNTYLRSKIWAIFKIFQCIFAVLVTERESFAHVSFESSEYESQRKYNENIQK